MKNNSFTNFAGWLAILASVFGFLYAVAFIVIARNRPELGALLSALFLLLGGFCSVVALTGLYRQVREVESSFALLAFVLSAGATAGALIHGGYDLSNALHPPSTLNLELPNPVDPRGLLTFGIAGAGLFFFSWLINRDCFAKGLSLLGYVSAFLMVVLYLGRLIILQPTNPAIVVPALLEGFLVNPIWYIWLGINLLGRDK